MVDKTEEVAPKVEEQAKPAEGAKEEAAPKLFLDEPTGDMVSKT